MSVIETVMAFLYVVFAELFAWIAALIFAGYLGFYVINLIVDALSPGLTRPPPPSGSES